MITVELRVPIKGSTAYETGATLHVDDDGRWTVTGDAGLIDPNLRVLDPDRGEFLTLEQDPARWARNLGTALRTGYLVPVVVDDPTPAVGETPA